MLIINGFTYESGRKNFPDFQIQIFSHFFSGLVECGFFVLNPYQEAILKYNGSKKQRSDVA